MYFLAGLEKLDKDEISNDHRKTEMVHYGYWGERKITSPVKRCVASISADVSASHYSDHRGTEGNYVTNFRGSTVHLKLGRMTTSFGPIFRLHISKNLLVMYSDCQAYSLLSIFRLCSKRSKKQGWVYSGPGQNPSAWGRIGSCLDRTLKEVRWLWSWGFLQPYSAPRIHSLWFCDVMCVPFQLSVFHWLP